MKITKKLTKMLSDKYGNKFEGTPSELLEFEESEEE